MKGNFDTNWFMPIRNEKAASVNIVCFPWGGGGASAFWSWKKIDGNVNIWALKLPGRESRIAESLITSASKLVDYIIEALPSSFRKPYIFYGHSMGAGIAMQTINTLYKMKRTLPKMLIASGRMAPHHTLGNPTIHLNDGSLIEYLQKLGGLKKTFLKNENFLKQYIPKIRSDYKLNSTIESKSLIKLPLAISIINGRNDPLIEIDELNSWEEYTQYPLSSHILPGNHFFIEKFFSKFMEKIHLEIQLIKLHNFKTCNFYSVL